MCKNKIKWNQIKQTLRVKLSCCALFDFQIQTVIWKNPRPSSPCFCRPLRIQSLHEDTEANLTEVDNIKEQVDKLVLFEKIVDGKELTISYQLSLTMLDRKVYNAITGTGSTERCYLCESTFKDFNKIDEILHC